MTSSKSEIKSKQLPADAPKTLLRAIKSNDLKTVTSIIAAGFNLNTSLENGERALWIAARNKDARIFEYLLTQDAHLKISTRNKKRLAEHVAIYAPWGMAKKKEILEALSKNGTKLPAVLKEVTLGSLDTTPIESFHDDYYEYGGYGSSNYAVKFKKARLKEKDTEGRTAIHYAIANGQTASLAFLIKEENSDRRDMSFLALHPNLILLAAELGQQGAMLLLLENGADIHEQIGEETPLRLAAKNGHVEIVKWLGRLYPEKLHEKDKEGRTPLNYLAQNEASEVMKWISSPTTSLDTPKAQDKTETKKSKTPSIQVHTLSLDEKVKVLFDAVKTNNRKTVDQLLESGMDINARPLEEPHTALWVAKENKDSGMFEYLLEKKANTKPEFCRVISSEEIAINCSWKPQEKEKILNLLRKIDEDSSLPDHFHAATCGDLNRLRESKTEILKEQDSSGKTILHYAALNGHPEIIRWAAESNAELSPRDRRGYTPFLSAVRNNQLETVRLLLEKDPDQINQIIKDYPNITALMLAARNGYFDMVKCLVEHAKKTHGETDKFIDFVCSAIPSSRDDNQIDILKYLMSFLTPQRKKQEINRTGYSGYTPFLLAARDNHLEIMTYLFLHGANIYYKYDLTGIELAIQEGHFDVALWFFNKDPQIIYRKNSSGRTLAHVAAKNGQLEILKWVIRYYPEALHEKDSSGFTPSMLAVMGGHGYAYVHTETLQWLLDNGANIHEKDNKGRTVLVMAAHAVDGPGANTDVVNMLVSRYGANPSDVNERGQSVREILQDTDINGRYFSDILKDKNLDVLYQDYQQNKKQKNEMTEQKESAERKTSLVASDKPKPVANLPEGQTDFFRARPAELSSSTSADSTITTPQDQQASAKK